MLAWSMSQKMGVRPSDLFDIDHPLHRFFFDRAVVSFGTAFDADIEEAGHKTKTRGQAKQAVARRVAVWLGTDQGAYRDPAGR